MRQKLRWLMVGLVLCGGVAQAQDKGTQWGENEILAYLEELISWQRDAAVSDTATGSARELLMQDAVRQQTTKALQYGFHFARAAAPVIDANRTAEADAAATDAEAQARRQKFIDMIAENDRQVEHLTQQQDTMAAQARRSAKAKAALATRREQVDIELTFALARQKLYQTVRSNTDQLGEGSGLAGKIENLARSIPEVALKTKTAAPADAAAVTPTTTTVDAAASAQPVSHASQGIFNLASSIFTASRKQAALQAYEDRTAALIESNRGLLANLRVSLENAAQQGAELAGHDQTPAALATQRKKLEGLVGQFNQVSDSIVPLVKALRWLDTTKRSVASWREVLDKQLVMLTRQLLLRLSILAMAIAIPLILSDLTRRAIQRYARDSRRQRQLNTVRRIVAGVVIVLVVVMNFISEFGSFMTFAGFLTAGLAVALQSVLLSLVAHFFFYGRYGVRAGDMIHVAGVTGEIMQIGMMRLYLREMTRDGDAMVPTGKMVAFPNSILFQPTAFYKYVNRTD